MVSFLQLLSLSLLAASASAAPKKQRVEVQAHRGGLGYQPESTLYAFRHALELGVDTLEMDTVFTKDGIPVIWHDHHVTAEKCRDTVEGANYVGSLVVDLTLEQLKTLDCGSNQLEEHPQQELHPGAQIPTLEEVLEFINCSGDNKVTINLETKLDPLAPKETWPASKYVKELIPLLRKHGLAERTTIQSFDWRTLIGIKALYPKTTTVALLDDTTIIPENGAFPWLGGISLGDFPEMSWILAAKTIGADVVSPVHGTPSDKSVHSPGYEEFTTEGVVRKAGKVGMKVVPWTVDEEATIEKLINDGVSAIISDYPERVMFVGRRMGVDVGKKPVKVADKCMAKAGGN